MLFGVAATSATAAGVVMAAIPAAVALLSRLVLMEPIAPRVRWAIALAGAGIAMLALARDPGVAMGDGLVTGSVAKVGGNQPAAAPWWGYALLLGAVFCEASYVVIGKRLSATVSPRRISALINLWGLALITPFGLWQARAFDFSAVDTATWALLVFYAIAASMITVWLWMHGLRHVPAARAGVVTVCLPLASALVGVGVLGEPFGPIHVAAMVLALAGLLLATWSRKSGSA
jgi:drug/metabolite transporter (DMT)-like permease